MLINSCHINKDFVYNSQTYEAYIFQIFVPHILVLFKTERKIYFFM